MNTSKTWLVWLLVFVFILTISPAWGGETDGNVPLQQQAPKSTERSSVARIMPGTKCVAPQIDWDRIAYGIAAVMGLLCVGVYGLKKLREHSFGSTGRYVDILDSRVLGRKGELVLVQVGERVVLLARTGDRIDKLAEFTRDELPEQEETGNRQDNGRFAGLMRSLVRGSEWKPGK